MTLASTIAATAGIAPNPLWGIGRYAGPDGHVTFPIGWDDWKRDTAWARDFLAGSGLTPGSGVVVIGGMPEAPWFDPVETAARELGSPYSIGEVLPFEAFRTGLYALRLPVGMIFGMNLAVADGLGEELQQVVSAIPTIFARPNAVSPIQAAGGRPFLVTRIGPALAVECSQRAGAHVNAAEWSVTERGGELRLSTVGPRAFRLEDVAVGVVGGIEAGPCACGRTDPRVTVDPTHAI
jgi:hypothetical protein